MDDEWLTDALVVTGSGNADIIGIEALTVVFCPCIVPADVDTFKSNEKNLCKITTTFNF